MNTSTTYPLRCTARTLASTTGPFLLIRLGATTGNFTANLGLMRAETSIRHLTDIGLVHQVHINRGFKDRRGKFHLAKLFTFYVEYIYFHVYLAPYPQGYCFRASLITTRPPLPPGTAP